ncbi:MAG: type fimbrial assembly protein PilB, partial [Verrucomicrobiales bacterium]|nr:type fimbrial assembly protein PilB [Verrucomicrobiales bacterium]
MSDVASNPLVELLRERGMLDDLQLEEVQQEFTRTAKPVGQIIHDAGFVEMDMQLQIIAQHLGTEFVDLRDFQIPEDALKTVPPDVARTHQCAPIGLYGNQLQVAFSDPLDPSHADEISFVTGKEIVPLVADPGQIDKLIAKFYGDAGDSVSDVLKEFGTEDLAKEAAELAASGESAEQMANETPIIRFVDLVLSQAVQDRASDIHFEPFEDEFKIRYRVDGALYEMSPPPKHLALPVISRLKVMANMDISERRLPQDGRISRKLANKQIDLRVSTLPTQFGESVVLRVLDRSAVNLDISAIGLPKAIQTYIMEAIQQPNGIFVVTGPTGSGKTTTLYS